MSRKIPKCNYAVMHVNNNEQKRSYVVNITFLNESDEIIERNTLKYRSLGESVKFVHTMRDILLRSQSAVIVTEGPIADDLHIPIERVEIMLHTNVYVVNATYHTLDEENHRQESYPFRTYECAEKFAQGIMNRHKETKFAEVM